VARLMLRKVSGPLVEFCDMGGGLMIRLSIVRERKQMAVFST
jgi:hypothetical protein